MATVFMRLPAAWGPGAPSIPNPRPQGRTFCALGFQRSGPRLRDSRSSLTSYESLPADLPAAKGTEILAPARWLSDELRQIAFLRRG